jgi:ATP/ADP translocase
LQQALNVGDGELGKLLPFFGLYLLLFGALTLADGFTLALFVQRVGRDYLPLGYQSIGAANFALVAWYFFWADGIRSTRIFARIIVVTLAVFVLSWLGIRFFQHNHYWFGLLFVSREVAQTMVLLHFGTFLQDYFTRAEMSRVLPAIYAGGRVGGILGASLLEYLSPVVGLVNLALVVAGMLLGGLFVLARIRRSQRLSGGSQIVNLSDHANCNPQSAISDSRSPSRTVQRQNNVVASDPREAAACATVTGFFRYVLTSPLLFWLTVTSMLFMICRWLLNFEYSAFFGEYFGNHALDMACFLGRYTQLALIVSLVLQLFVVSRLIDRFGLRITHVAYSVLMAAALILNLLPMTLGLAVFARFVETELRFGLRNPIMQLITNHFSKALRTRVRSWTMGVLTPVSTLLAAALLGGLVDLQLIWLIPALGAVLALVYLVGSIRLGRRLPEKALLEPPLAQLLRSKEVAYRGDATAA